MEFGASEYIAIGFPLLIGLLLVVLYPINPEDYFSEEELNNAEVNAQPCRLGLKQSLYVYLVYIVSASVLGLIQAYLLWRFAVNPEVRFSTRFTDYIFYPFIVSALMAVFVMWFVFSCHAFSGGNEKVRNFLRRSFDGWWMMAEVKHFKYLVITGAVVCVAANFWAYNIFLSVTDEGVVVSNHRMIGSYVFDYDRIDYFEIEWHRAGAEDDKNEFFVLALKLKDGGYVRTDLNMFYNNHMLLDIDRVVSSASAAKGMPIQTVLTEFPHARENEARRVFSAE